MVMIERVETGDTTYDDRVTRYEYIVARRAEKPQPTLQAIGDALGITRQNVHRLLKRGGVRPAGRPRSDAGRRKFLIKRLTSWQTRRLKKLAVNKPTEVEDGWITKIEVEIQGLV
jgi:hypothetical protein